MLTHYLTNTVLESQFRGTTQQFPLHLNEQFRRLDDLTDISERMPESIKMALLQNALKDSPQMSIVETLDEYISTTCGDGSLAHLNYSLYYNLHINDCVRYDANNRILSKDQILVSCSHMTCYLQNSHNISIFIFF